MPSLSPLPLPGSQQRIWLESQASSGKSDDTIALVIRFDGPLDEELFQGAVHEALCEQEILRSYCAIEDGTPRMGFATLEKPPMVVEETFSEPLLASFLQRSFALTEPFLFAAKMWRRGGPGTVAALLFNRFVADESSLSVFMRSVELHSCSPQKERSTPPTTREANPAALAEAIKCGVERDNPSMSENVWDEVYQSTGTDLELGDGDYVRHTAGPGSETFALPASVAAALRRFATQSGYDIAILLRAGLLALLNRYTWSRNLGLLQRGFRRPPGTDNSLGPLEMLIPEWASFDESTSFVDLLQALSAQTPCRHDQGQHAGEKPTGNASLLACFSDLRLMPGSIRLGQATGVISLERPGGGPLPLELGVLTGQGVRLLLVHAGGRFSSGFLARFKRHYAMLLQALCRKPEESIRALPFITKREKHSILNVWNASDVLLPQGLLLHDQFVEKAIRSPEALALLSSEHAFTRGQVLSLACRVANGLRRDGVGPGRLVAVAMPKSPWQAVAIIAVSLAGGAYLPIDAQWPASRVAEIIRQAEPSCILTLQSHTPKLVTLADCAGISCRILDDLTLWDVYPDSIPERLQGPDDLAYIVFTSGSTGTPKGAAMTHRAAMNSILDVNRRYRVSEADSVFALANLSFDLSTYDVFGVLGAGGSVCFPDHDKLRNPGHWLDVMRRHPITIWNTVPGFMVMLLDAADSFKNSGQGKLPNNLRLVMLCGDFMPLTLPGRMAKLFPKAKVHNLGGATECSIWSVTYPVGRIRSGWKSVPYGRPLGNQKVYVFDNAFEHCPVMAPGRICLAGQGVGAGYYRNTKLTDAAFVTHPGTGERLYITGDIGRWLPDGNVELLGREDRQIKIKGFRIELAEIENALETLPGVARAVVSAVGEHEKKRLAAYVVPKEETRCTAGFKAQLQNLLAAKLPHYMVPEYFVGIRNIPLSDNGKIRREDLPAPTENDLVLSTEFLPPRTQRERILVQIISKIIGVQRVGIGDNFRALGGDSLQSLEVSVAAEARGLSITPEQVLTAESIATLAREARIGQSLTSPGETHPGVYPMLPVQRYFFGWATHNPNHFNVSELFCTAGQLDVKLLNLSLRRLVDQHDSLRLRFYQLSQGNWEQRLEESESACLIPVEVRDVAGQAENDMARTISQGCCEAEASLDITKGPVMRLVLFDAGPERDSHVLLTCHHLVNDGYSFKFLVDDLQTIYMALSDGEQPLLPRKAAFYGEFAKKLVSYAQSPKAKAQMPYWQSMTQSRTLFPVDYAGQSALQKDIRVYSAQVMNDVGLSKLAKQARGGLHARIKHLLLAALLASAHEISGQSKLTLHIVGHGREASVADMDISRSCGWFVTHTPLTLGIPFELLAGPLHFGRLTASVGDQEQAIPDRGIGHGAMRYYSDMADQRALAPLDEVTTLFNYLGPAISGMHEGQLLSQPAIRLSDRPDPVDMNNPADYILYLFSYIQNNALYVDFCYSSSHYTEPTIQKMSQRFKRRLSETT